jgi:hypothetical protein
MSNLLNLNEIKKNEKPLERCVLFELAKQEEHKAKTGKTFDTEKYKNIGCYQCNGYNGKCKEYKTNGWREPF